MVEYEKFGPTAISERIVKLLKTEALAVLGTTGTNGPHVCLILFAVSDDCSELYFATNQDTLKFRNISSEPRVSVLLDNRGTRASDGKGFALTLNGIASVLEGEKAQNALHILLAKNTVHGSTVDAEKCSVVGIKFTTCHLVSTDAEQTFYKFD